MDFALSTVTIERGNVQTTERGCVERDNVDTTGRDSVGTTEKGSVETTEQHSERVESTEPRGVEVTEKCTERGSVDTTDEHPTLVDILYTVPAELRVERDSKDELVEFQRRRQKELMMYRRTAKVGNKNHLHKCEIVFFYRLCT